jgi:hypothetical protein
VVYRGQVRGDVIVLAQDVRLPEGTEVLVQTLESKPPAKGPVHFEMRNGIAVFPRGGRTDTPNLDRVNKLRDEAP